MTSHKVTIVAWLQFMAAAIGAIVGYFVITPRHGRWGIAFTLVALALGLYWAAVIAIGKRPKRRVAHREKR